jgi:hypothetical protein
VPRYYGSNNSSLSYVCSIIHTRVNYLLGNQDLLSKSKMVDACKNIIQHDFEDDLSAKKMKGQGRHDGE